MPKKRLEQIQKELVRGLRVSRRRTREPVILAMIGITGAGNSTVARALAKRLGWSVIEKNRIRVKLREDGPGFKPATTDQIAYAMLAKVMRERGNAILDSDFVERPKRKRLIRFAKRFRARVAYLHLICDSDVMLGRMLRASYNPRTDMFKSAAIAVREHSRRYPWHYRWSPGQGGQYIARRPPGDGYGNSEYDRSGALEEAASGVSQAPPTNVIGDTCEAATPRISLCLSY